ncbi:hypothetical protein [Pseudomonas syringae]|uniref:hypothetical protein n=1 Tax=Pseudomonas syringae TaxID=317 RepID=UPI000354FC00|nr:hypothetical protein [Pseudomonas syringae]AQL40068.1 hypothetical protein JN853_29070 [Pseudomonas syringae pv. actinidiae ICMP 9853]EPM83582.1 hypothetical protein A260_23920 [Pseudomonas syringae pv. actinidiae ICMP 19068]EPM93794.1 hypothetical protein A258_23203 [Pseudomonas syringae pv. actinidiae ICMP 19104]EPN08310.1 hypothetical protein A252_23050 [Pseudomonas syringae pv. actinidiae ICMP 9855]KCU95278.1 hypothetical protein A250_25251 [Pseudomonas syringae pv. actinidiae ICMP 9617
MQAQHIIILTALIVCFLLLTALFEKAIKWALRRSYRAGQSAGVTLKNIGPTDIVLNDISRLPHTRNQVEALIKRFRRDVFFQKIRGASV